MPTPEGLVVRACGPEAAAEIHRLTQLAFAGYAWVDPPSGALRETEADVRRDLERHGGALAWLGGQTIGGLRFEREPGVLRVRRLAIDPEHQRQGIGSAMMEWAHGYARMHGFSEISLGVRSQLPGNRRFYERLGYRVVGDHSHPGRTDVTWHEMRKRLAD